MCSSFQLLNRNPKHRLGAKRDAAELKEHPFFKDIDWSLLSRKEITPPFKPVVESDESVNNFDPEFTSADISNMTLNGSNIGNLDDDDPSEAWVSQSFNQGNGFVHTPVGPLGSEPMSSHSQSRSGLVDSNPSVNTHQIQPLSSSSHQPLVTPSHRGFSSLSSSSSSNNTTAQTIQIKQTKTRSAAAGTPLTNSVQENFRGFTFHGESLVVPPGMLSRERGDGEDDGHEEGDEVTTEDEVEDTKRSAGRYANLRRKGLGFSAMDDDL